eukprot:TRINITY_DN25695_c0_g1_i1.p3 TRINITY_DN25695_c0_g1~~TRINITY_DN25695_c0_g1_i1.p3  ORF type:complete len:225 (-),score=-15.62 TRINITY_DN25695_c0_g1_i1:1115-1789(-)
MCIRDRYQRRVHGDASGVDLCNCLFSTRLSIRAATAFFSVGYAIYNINTITTRDLDSAVVEGGAHAQNLLFNTREGMYCWELLNYTYRHRYADFIMHMHQMCAADMMVHRSIEYMLYHYSTKKLGRVRRAEWVIYGYYCYLNKRRTYGVSKPAITLKFSRVRRWFNKFNIAAEQLYLYKHCTLCCIQNVFTRTIRFLLFFTKHTNFISIGKIASGGLLATNATV